MPQAPEAPPPGRIGLFGGTFDPIHRGHLAAARAVLDAGLVGRVLFVPAGSPPHKPRGTHASDVERYVMAVLATLDEPRFGVARFELDRPGPSYAIETAVQAGRALGVAPGEKLAWIIGTDAMAQIGSWWNPRGLFEQLDFLVVSRREIEEPALREKLAETVPWAPPTSVSFVPMPYVDVSSTAVRAGLQAGDAAALAALPEPVATYVRRYGLYDASPSARYGFSPS